VGLVDLAGDPDGHHLRGRHLGIATHPVTPQTYWLIAHDTATSAAKPLTGWGFC
jgi:hypothetical protein